MKYDKLIFVCRDNLYQSPMAAAIMKCIRRDEWLRVESRGLIVLFPEPFHSRAYAVLRNNGIIMENGTAAQLREEDFGEKTLILTMDREGKQKILTEYEYAQNVFTIMEFAGGSGDIMDPYGGDNDLYAMFYESIKGWVTLAEKKLHEINNQSEEAES